VVTPRDSSGQPAFVIAGSLVLFDLDAQVDRVIDLAPSSLR
jgi:hypothetical protein